MITYSQLETNLTTLAEQMPPKPASYTLDYPKTLGEALHKYCNTRTIHSMELHVSSLNEAGWPLPLYINPDKIKVGFWNRLALYKWGTHGKLKGYTWLHAPFLSTFIKIHESTSSSIMEIFSANWNFIKTQLRTHSFLLDKHQLIEEIIFTYNKGYYSACINIVFPVLDTLTRKIFRTGSLRKDIKVVKKMFEDIGFGKDKLSLLTPFAHGMKAFKDSWDQKVSHQVAQTRIDEGYRYRLGLIGPALNSFLYFAYEFYGYYKEDVGDTNILNRHAIIHGAVNEFGSRENAVKVLTFLYLLLELEPVLTQLFSEPIPQPPITTQSSNASSRFSES